MPEPISARPHAFYIRPAPGWLEVLHDEVTSLVETPLHKYKYAPKVTRLKGTVKLHRCDWRQGLEILLRLTTAHDVEWLILESKCTKWTEVDAILERVPWDDILPSRDAMVHVTTDVFHGFSSSSGKLRDNLVRIAGVTHASEGAPFRFKIELREDFLRLMISLAGEPLYKRGYKASLTAHAPLTEHQAAACTRYVLSGATDADPVTSIFVPFAGSGTFGFEALVVLSQSGPGSFPREFACDRFPCTPEATMKFLRRKLSERLTSAPLPEVLFNDFNEAAISALRENTAVFPAGRFELVQADVFGLQPKLPPTGTILVLLNPPYGDRLAAASDIPTLYRRLGGYLKEIAAKHPGRILGGCLCPDERTWRSFLNSLGAVSPDTHHFTHGGKEMRIVRFRI